MYGIFTYIYHKNQLNVGKYTSPMDPLGMKSGTPKNQGIQGLGSLPKLQGPIGPQVCIPVKLQKRVSYQWSETWFSWIGGFGSI